MRPVFPLASEVFDDIISLDYIDTDFDGDKHISRFTYQEYKFLFDENNSPLIDLREWSEEDKNNPDLITNEINTFLLNLEKKLVNQHQTSKSSIGKVDNVEIRWEKGKITDLKKWAKEFDSATAARKKTIQDLSEKARSYIIDVIRFAGLEDAKYNSDRGRLIQYKIEDPITKIEDLGRLDSSEKLYQTVDELELLFNFLNGGNGYKYFDTHSSLNLSLIHI